MPRLTNLGIDPLSAPGITPGILALVITGLGTTLFLRSIRTPTARSEGAHAAWTRLTIALCLCLLYALGLVGQIDFLIATALFVFTFALLFSETGQSLARRLLISALLAATTSVAVTMLFERVFLIRLP